jgi:two-component system OmpR family sensor kinase
MSKLSIRTRLTLAFAAAMGIVLAVTGFLLVHHLATSLDRTLDQGLHAQATDVAALVQQADTGLREAPPAPVGSGGSFAQVLDAKGKIVDQTRGLGAQALLSGLLLERARAKPVLVSRTSRLGVGVRLLAVPVHAQDKRLVIVVGAPLDSRDQALATLRRELQIGGPIALLVASLIGYLIAAAALRPVERMRARAGSISEQDLSKRLPLPRAHDEIERLGVTLNEMLARIEKGVERERSFVADASHELRSPLALLRAEVELALESPRDEEELRTALHSIGEEVDRLSQLAEDLLLLARLDEGRLPLREETIELDELLNGVAARFERRAADSDRSIEVNSSNLQVNGDRPRLEQALGNLVENALRHGAGAVSLSGREKPGCLEIHVTDRGMGFPADFGAIAFERFTRADSARTGTGSGLGLAIVKAIAEAHGGAVGLSPQDEAATDVFLSLPTEAESYRGSPRISA